MAGEGGKGMAGKERGLYSQTSSTPATLSVWPDEVLQSFRRALTCMTLRRRARVIMEKRERRGQRS